MSQHDFEITTADANSGVAMRAAINAALQALASNNLGLTEPADPYAGMWWADTTSGTLWLRNTANTAWLDKGLIADQGIHAATSKTTPVDADEIPMSDSAASWGLKKLTWANIKACLFGSPVLTGIPQAPSAPAGTNTTQIATTAFVETATSPIQLLTDIKTVAGAGSGLDADLLDGFSGSYYWSQSTTSLELSLTETGDRTPFIDFHASNGVDFSARILRDPGVNGTFWVAQSGEGKINFIGGGGVTVATPMLLGYGTGAGGSVTQLTSKATSVTIDKPCGVIYTHDSTLTPGETTFFTVNNSFVTSPGTIVVVNRGGGGGFFSHTVELLGVGTGYFSVSVQNDLGVDQSNSVTIHFAVLSTATS